LPLHATAHCASNRVGWSRPDRRICSAKSAPQGGVTVR